MEGITGRSWPSNVERLLTGDMAVQAHLEDLEQEQGIQGEILYALYPDQGGDWRVQAIPVEPDSFQSRLALPEPWRGKRDDELSQLTGIAGCIFVRTWPSCLGACASDAMRLRD